MGNFVLLTLPTVASPSQPSRRKTSKTSSTPTIVTSDNFSEFRDNSDSEDNDNDSGQSDSSDDNNCDMILVDECSVSVSCAALTSTPFYENLESEYSISSLLTDECSSFELYLPVESINDCSTSAISTATSASLSSSTSSTSSLTVSVSPTNISASSGSSSLLKVMGFEARARSRLPVPLASVNAISSIQSSCVPVRYHVDPNSGQTSMSACSSLEKKTQTSVRACTRRLGVPVMPLPRSKSFHQLLRSTQNGQILASRGTIRGNHSGNGSSESASVSKRVATAVAAAGDGGSALQKPPRLMTSSTASSKSNATTTTSPTTATHVQNSSTTVNNDKHNKLNNCRRTVPNHHHHNHHHNNHQPQEAQMVVESSATAERRTLISATSNTNNFNNNSGRNARCSTVPAPVSTIVASRRGGICGGVPVSSSSSSTAAVNLTQNAESSSKRTVTTRTNTTTTVTTATPNSRKSGTNTAGNTAAHTSKDLASVPLTSKLSQNKLRTSITRTSAIPNGANSSSSSSNAIVDTPRHTRLHRSDTNLSQSVVGGGGGSQLNSRTNSTKNNAKDVHEPQPQSLKSPSPRTAPSLSSPSSSSDTNYLSANIAIAASSLSTPFSSNSTVSSPLKCLNASPNFASSVMETVQQRPLSSSLSESVVQSSSYSTHSTTSTTTISGVCRLQRTRLSGANQSSIPSVTSNTPTSSGDDVNSTHNFSQSTCSGGVIDVNGGGNDSLRHPSETVNHSHPQRRHNHRTAALSASDHNLLLLTSGSSSSIDQLSPPSHASLHNAKSQENILLEAHSSQRRADHPNSRCNARIKRSVSSFDGGFHSKSNNVFLLKRKPTSAGGGTLVTNNNQTILEVESPWKLRRPSPIKAAPFGESPIAQYMSFEFLNERITSRLQNENDFFNIRLFGTSVSSNNDSNNSDSISDSSNCETSSSSSSGGSSAADTVSHKSMSNSSVDGDTISQVEHPTTNNLSESTTHKPVTGSKLQKKKSFRRMLENYFVGERTAITTTSNCANNHSFDLDSSILAGDYYRQQTEHLFGESKENFLLKRATPNAGLTESKNFGRSNRNQNNAIHLGAIRQVTSTTDRQLEIFENILRQTVMTTVVSDDKEQVKNFGLVSSSKFVLEDQKKQQQQQQKRPQQSDFHLKRLANITISDDFSDANQVNCYGFDDDTFMDDILENFDSPLSSRHASLDDLIRQIDVEKELEDYRYFWIPLNDLTSESDVDSNLQSQLSSSESSSSAVFLESSSEYHQGYTLEFDTLSLGRTRNGKNSSDLDCPKIDSEDVELAPLPNSAFFTLSNQLKTLLSNSNRLKNTFVHY